MSRFVSASQRSSRCRSPCPGRSTRTPAPELAEYFADLPAGDDDITLDLSAVEFMDSSGLRVILELHQRAQDGSRRLLLRTPSPAVARLFEIAGLQDHLHIVG